MKIKRFRPLPSEEIYEVIKRAKKLAVIDRNLSAGVGGIFAQELRASLYNKEVRPQLFGFVSGLGGRDITPNLIEEAIRYTLDHHPGLSAKRESEKRYHGDHGRSANPLQEESHVVPVKEYLKLQGRFSQLADKDIEKIQEMVDDEWERLLR